MKKYTKPYFEIKDAQIKLHVLVGSTKGEMEEKTGGWDQSVDRDDSNTGDWD